MDSLLTNALPEVVVEGGGEAKRETRDRITGLHQGSGSRTKGLQSSTNQRKGTGRPSRASQCEKKTRKK